jgi:tetratricopeptide (TPR) repeat protein
LSAQFNDSSRGSTARDRTARRRRGYGIAHRPSGVGASLAAAAALVLLLSACSPGAPTRPAERASVAAAGSAGARPPSSVAAGEPASAAALADYENALASMRRGDWVEAELRLEQLIGAYPGLPGPYVNAAIVYRQEGRDRDARAALERALSIDPGHSQANNELGILLREAGEFAAAEEAYRRALDTDPKYLPSLYNLGVLLDLYLHRRDEALECYEAYQLALTEPDETVARWIIDLRRRVGAGAERVAQREAP